jgi:hypothetical protein
VGARGQNHLGLDYSPGTLTHSIIDARYLSETKTKSERRRIEHDGIAEFMEILETQQADA